MALTHKMWQSGNAAFWHRAIKKQDGNLPLQWRVATLPRSVCQNYNLHQLIKNHVGYYMQNLLR